MPRQLVPFTRTEDRRLRAARRAGYSLARIGRTLDRSAYAVKRRCQELGIAPAPRAKPSPPQRRCLHCGRPFVPAGPFNRLCAPCKHSELFQASSGDFQVLE